MKSRAEVEERSEVTGKPLPAQRFNRSFDFLFLIWLVGVCVVWYISSVHPQPVAAADRIPLQITIVLSLLAGPFLLVLPFFLTPIIRSDGIGVHFTDFFTDTATRVPFSDISSIVVGTAYQIQSGLGSVPESDRPYIADASTKFAELMTRGAKRSGATQAGLSRSSGGVAGSVVGAYVAPFVAVTMYICLKDGTVHLVRLDAIKKGPALFRLFRSHGVIVVDLLYGENDTKAKALATDSIVGFGIVATVIMLMFAAMIYASQ